MNKLLLLLTVILVARLPVMAQTAKPTQQPEPRWITHNEIDYTNTKLDKDAEDGYIHLDFERQVAVKQQSLYIRHALKIISEAGIQNASEVSVDYDPSYTKLIFHTIQIRRNGAVINKLQLNKIKVVQQEEELSRYLYNGDVSAILFLEDVRKGDVIEYSYTLQGFNPVFNGKYADEFNIGYSVPLYNVYYKVLLPSDRILHIKNQSTDIECKKSAVGTETVYEWKQDNVMPLREQDQLPGWYDPYPSILVSEYNSWKEVSEWAVPLFPFNNKLSPALREKIATIQATHETPAARVQAALRFVQDEVRYMGIEMGSNSHKPHAPDKVFAQRFGDCKDKSYLLCTILKTMDIEAHPVLINTIAKNALHDKLPTPTTFDHVTVQTRIGNRLYYFDPTISYQRGVIDSIYYPDYRCGLVISDTTTALTAISNPNNGTVLIKENFKIKDMAGACRLVVHTVYTGSYADDMRQQFNENSNFEMQKRFKNFYANYFEDITADSVLHTDEDSTGHYATTEYYTIKNIWKLENEVRKGYFSPFVINSILKKPKDLDRKMPFYITYPANYKEEVTIVVPDEWEAEESKHTVTNAAFKFSSDYSYHYRIFSLKYSYQSLKDHVMPKEAKSFYEDFDKADDGMYYTISVEDGNAPLVRSMKSGGKTSTGTLVILVFVVLGVIGLVVWFTQRQSR